MAIYIKPIEDYKVKLYQREREFNFFKDITEEQLNSITKAVYRRLQSEDELPPHRKIKSNSERYISVLTFLTAPQIHTYYRSFDERILYLILATDPNLQAFNEFLKTDIPSISEIAAIEDCKTRDMLFTKRNHIIDNLETRIRQKVGFCDFKFLKFEEALFKKIYSSKEIIKDVEQNNISAIINPATKQVSLDSVSDERYQELVDLASYWLSKVSTKPNSKTAAYSIINQNKLLKLKSIAEQITFFILITDPELDMLRIYEEESMMPKTQKRITDEFGYYHSGMLKLEKLYHERFCPNKTLSIWSEPKKTQN